MYKYHPFLLTVITGIVSFIIFISSFSYRIISGLFMSLFLIVVIIKLSGSLVFRKLIDAFDFHPKEREVIFT